MERNYVTSAASDQEHGVFTFISPGRTWLRVPDIARCPWPTVDGPVMASSTTTPKPTAGADGGHATAYG